MQNLAAFVGFIQLHCLKSMKRRIFLIVFSPIVTFKSSASNWRFKETITLGIYWFLSKLRGIINVSICNILQPSLYFMTIWSILSSEFYIAIIEKFIVIYVKEMRACSSYYDNVSNIYLILWRCIPQICNALYSNIWHLMKEVKRNRRNEVTLYLSENFAFAIGICIS